MSAARGVTFVALCASWPVLGCSSARPAEPGGVHQTFEIADVGVYTGGWTGREEGAETGDAGTAADAAPPPEGILALGIDDSTGTGSCGAPGRVCGVSELADVNCGGAARQLNPPVPDPGRGLVVRAGEVNDPAVPITASTRTDAQGRFAFELGTGTWCIVEEAKLDESAIAALEASGAASSCLQSWARLCDAVVTVGSAPVAEVQLLFQRWCGAGPCFPGLPYP